MSSFDIFAEQLNSNEIFNPKSNAGNQKMELVIEAEKNIKTAIYEIQSIVECLDMWRGNARISQNARRYLNTKSLVKHRQNESNHLNKLALKHLAILNARDIFKSDFQKMKQSYHSSSEALKELRSIAQDFKIVYEMNGMFVNLHEGSLNSILGIYSKPLVSLEDSVSIKFPPEISALKSLSVECGIPGIPDNLVNFTLEDTYELEKYSFLMLDNAIFTVLKSEICNSKDYSVVSYEHEKIALRIRIPSHRNFPLSFSLEENQSNQTFKQILYHLFRKYQDKNIDNLLSTYICLLKHTYMKNQVYHAIIEFMKALDFDCKVKTKTNLMLESEYQLIQTSENKKLGTVKVCKARIFLNPTNQTMKSKPPSIELSYEELNRGALRIILA